MACFLRPLGPGLLAMAFGLWLACYGLWALACLLQPLGPWLADYGL
jgi:hypothetical protein